MDEEVGGSFAAAQEFWRGLDRLVSSVRAACLILSLFIIFSLIPPIFLPEPPKSARTPARATTEQKLTKKTRESEESISITDGITSFSPLVFFFFNRLT